MRRMFSENQIKSIVNQGIESGEINVEKPLVEIPMITDDYELSINLDDTYVYVGESSDYFQYLLPLIDCYLYGYVDNDLTYVIKITIIDGGQMRASTSFLTSDVHENTTWKIFSK